jgi:hypothetical protein
MSPTELMLTVALLHATVPDSLVFVAGNSLSNP